MDTIASRRVRCSLKLPRTTPSNPTSPADCDTFALCGLQVSLLIRRELFERAKDFNIILDDVAITELSFSREYTAAVEAKQVGECALPRTATRWRQWSVVPVHQRVFFCSPAGGAASSVLCGESQAGPETEDHPG